MSRPRRQQSGTAFRSYSLRIDANLYEQYQDLARDLGVTMSRLLAETLEYGLRGGDEPPPWWDEWERRAAQEALVSDPRDVHTTRRDAHARREVQVA